MNITGSFGMRSFKLITSSETTYNGLVSWPGGAFSASQEPTATLPVVSTSGADWAKAQSVVFDASKNWTGVKNLPKEINYT